MKFIKKHWRILCAGYVLIYLPWFFILEHINTLDSPRMHIINVPLDSKIPFCEYFIIPYVLWFLYIVVGCLYMYLKADDREFAQIAVSLIAGMSICMVICMIYPNGITLRPDYIPDNLCGRIVAGLYVTDTSTNVFPSIHCYNSLAIHIALCKCKAMKNTKHHKIILSFSFVLCIAIILSTMFLKQHSVVDVMGAFILMAVMYVVVYVIDWKKITSRRKAKASAEVTE